MAMRTMRTLMRICRGVSMGCVEESSRKVCFDVPFLVIAHNPILVVEDACAKLHDVHLERLWSTMEAT